MSSASKTFGSGSKSRTLISAWLHRLAEVIRSPSESLSTLLTRIVSIARRTGAETSITFVNQTRGTVEIFWLAPDGDAQSYGKLEAGQEFRHALNLDPAFAPAVFNLALFYERTNAAEQAAVQWKRYLQLDPNSDWAREARDRLQGLSR